MKEEVVSKGRNWRRQKICIWCQRATPSVSSICQHTICKTFSIISFCKDCSSSYCTQLEGADQPLWSDKLGTFKRGREENRLSVTDALRNYLLLNKRLWISRGKKDGNLQGDATQWGQLLRNFGGAFGFLNCSWTDGKSCNVQNVLLTKALL